MFIIKTLQYRPIPTEETRQHNTLHTQRGSYKIDHHQNVHVFLLSTD